MPTLKTHYPDTIDLSYMMQELLDGYTVHYRNQDTGKQLQLAVETLEEAQEKSAFYDCQLLAGMIKRYRDDVKHHIRHNDREKRNAQKALGLLTVAAFALEGARLSIDDLQPGLPAFCPELIMQATGTAGIALKDLTPEKYNCVPYAMSHLYGQLHKILHTAGRRYETVLVPHP